MSKYYKAEDVINAIEDKIAEYIPVLYGRYCEMPLEIRMAIESLPTIEVSEDCISRVDLQALFNETTTSLMSKIDQKDIEHLARACVMVTGMIQDAPSVLPTADKLSAVGEWHRVSADKYVQHAYHYYRCSECEEDTIGEPNYCPNCGAKMKG